LQDARRAGFGIAAGLASHRPGRALGLVDRRAVVAAYEDGQQALVGRHFRDVIAQPRLIALFHQFRDPILHRMHHQLRAQLDVRAKPFRQQPFDIRQTEIRDDAGGKRDRQHEAQHDRAKHRASVLVMTRRAYKIPKIHGSVSDFVPAGRVTITSNPSRKALTTATL
jgi:hypothetical protein